MPVSGPPSAECTTGPRLHSQSLPDQIAPSPLTGIANGQSALWQRAFSLLRRNQLPWKSRRGAATVAHITGETACADPGSHLCLRLCFFGGRHLITAFFFRMWLCDGHDAKDPFVQPHPDKKKSSFPFRGERPRASTSDGTTFRI